MRPAPFRLLVPAVLLAAACADDAGPTAPEATDAPEAPDAPVVADVPAHANGPLEDLAYFADGHLLADAPTTSSYSPLPQASFNRSGGAMRVVKVPGTTGRYVARLTGLSALLGGKSTVRVTAIGEDPDARYCKPVGGFLVRDSVEVRCFRLATGAAVNTAFTLQVVGKRDNLAFAFANQPTATAPYTATNAGTWNPAGATRVHRDGVGLYRVVFAGLGARLPVGVGGHVQINGVSSSKAYCKVQGWGGAPDLTVSVGCFAPGGRAMDAKFTALFTPPAAHLAYLWADSPSYPEYAPYRVLASNPVGGAMTITRYGVGLYQVSWTGVDAEIRGYGSVQVTAYNESEAMCKATGIAPEWVSVQCYAGNGVPMDAQYVVSLGS